jgi:hypothetical protein
MKKIKQIKLLLIILLFGATSVVVTSCYPDYGLTTSDYDVVTTFKNDATDFQTYRTCFIPDSIKKILDGGKIEGNGGQYDQQVLKEIENQMIANGYQIDNNPTTADVVLYVATTSSKTYTYYPGWWGGYYGWYYPWYGYGGVYYSYTTGSLFIDMVDRDKFDPDKKITGTIWVGVVNGLLDNSSSIEIKTRVVNSIDKMFEQSPYLKIIE